MNETNQNKTFFEKEDRISKYFLNKASKGQDISFLKDLFRLSIFNLESEEKDNLIQLYEILGFEKFFEVVTFFSNKKLDIPDIQTVKKRLLSSLIFYQSTVLGLSSKDILKIIKTKMEITDLKKKDLLEIIESVQKDIGDQIKKVMED